MQGSDNTETPRRLATILAADVAGSSRLMGIDEEGTLARLKRHRRELIEPTIAEHHGRIVKLTGDGYLAEFASPVEAVRCAVVIQQSMMGRNAALPRDQWIQFRIGVNLGDIIIDTDDIYGDGVNIAARLEGLAEPGSVYISGGVYELVKNKLVVGYQSLGDQRVKNITDPVHVYRVLPDPAAVRLSRHMHARPAMLRWIPIAAAATGAAAIVLTAGWYAWNGKTVSTDARAVAPQPARTVAAVPPAAPFGPTPSPSLVPSAPAPVPLADLAPAAPPAVAPPKPEEPRTAVIDPPRPPAPAAMREPEMVAIAGGEFMMGSRDDPSEQPIHRVTIKPFLIGKYPVTVGEWKACVAAGGCDAVPTRENDVTPMDNLSWTDAKKFAAWLSSASGRKYRLPTESEWEYAARAGTQTKYWWGDQIKPGMAYCKGCGGAYDPREPLKVGSLPANPFGVYDMAGGVAEWVEDCWHHDYHGAPETGGAWNAVDCRSHVLRGGSWRNDPSYLRAASRDQYDTGVRYVTHGFRVARSE